MFQPRSEEDTSVGGALGTVGMSLERRRYQEAGFSEAVVGTIQAGRRESSTKLYATYWRLFERHCVQKGINPVQADIGTGLNFLQELLDDPKIYRGYSAINTARSALSAVIIRDSGIQFGEHPDVKLFMKGVFNQRPTRPRYTEIWDSNDVLEFLKTWWPAKRMSMKRLTLKLAMLILLVTGQRGQILSGLDVENMQISDSCYKFTVDNKFWKQSRRGYKPEQIVLKKFPADKRLCVFHYLTVYLERTLDCRGTVKQLFLTLKKPYEGASRDTLARWIKEVLKLAGINVGVFGPGSTRSASTSKAQQQGASVDELLRGGVE